MRRELCISFTMTSIEQLGLGRVCVEDYNREGLRGPDEHQVRGGAAAGMTVYSASKTCPALVISAQHSGRTGILCLVLRSSPQCEVHC